jgi:hypothetical protein
VASVTFTSHLERHLAAPPAEVRGGTVREALEDVFDRNPLLRGYLLDDQGALRQHVVVFVDGQMVEDRKRLSDPIDSSSELFVMQALSGG